MNDYFLKFSDETEATAVLFTSIAAQLDEEGNVVVEASEKANYVNISVIGVITKDEVALEGWHVNVRADVSPELEQYQVFPLAPMRVWA